MISAVVCAGIYVLLYNFSDQQVVLWFHNEYADTHVFNAGNFISNFATGVHWRLVVAICLILIVIHDSIFGQKPWTKYILYICVTISIASIIGYGLKYFLGRYRPIMYIDKELYGLTYFARDWALNSTPSGHTLRAFSLLTALSVIFRRFTPVFVLMALLIGISRVVVTDHYPSDILFGAFIGIFSALWTYKYFFHANSRKI